MNNNNNKKKIKPENKKKHTTHREQSHALTYSSEKSCSLAGNVH